MRWSMNALGFSIRALISRMVSIGAGTRIQSNTQPVDQASTESVHNLVETSHIGVGFLLGNDAHDSDET